MVTMSYTRSPLSINLITERYFFMDSFPDTHTRLLPYGSSLKSALPDIIGLSTLVMNTSLPFQTQQGQVHYSPITQHNAYNGAQ